MSEHLIFDLNSLSDRCDEVNPIDAQQTIKKLHNKLNKYKDLYALCAPQIGIKERVISIKFNDVIKDFINPMVESQEKYHYIVQKDICVPDKEFIVFRPTKIKIRYQTADAKPEENILLSPAAEIFTLMINYLDGVTIADDGLEIDPEWDYENLSDEDKEQLVTYLYPLYIKRKAESANKEVEDDKDAKELKEAIEFMKAVDEGKVQFDTSVKMEKKDGNL